MLKQTTEGGIEMAKKKNFLDWIAFVLILIGALNWGLVGFFHFDLVVAIFGSMSTATRIVYAIVGVAGVYAIIRALCCCGKCPVKSGKK